MGEDDIISSGDKVYKFEPLDPLSRNMCIIFVDMVVDDMVVDDEMFHKLMSMVEKNELFEELMIVVVDTEQNLTELDNARGPGYLSRLIRTSFAGPSC
ncbi:hypothetical protein Tco_0448477 [Tanacetum coccineum]